MLLESPKLHLGYTYTRYDAEVRWKILPSGCCMDADEPSLWEEPLLMGEDGNMTSEKCRPEEDSKRKVERQLRPLIARRRALTRT